MNTNDGMTDTDWGLLEEAVRGRHATPKADPAPRAAPPPEEPPRIRTADEILAEFVPSPPSAMVSVARKNVVSTNKLIAAGLVYADDHPATAAPVPTAPSTSDSPELVELRAIRAELTSLCALVATAINKMPSRR